MWWAASAVWAALSLAVWVQLPADPTALDCLRYSALRGLPACSVALGWAWQADTPWGPALLGYAALHLNGAHLALNLAALALLSVLARLARVRPWDTALWLLAVPAIPPLTEALAPTAWLAGASAPLHAGVVLIAGRLLADADRGVRGLGALLLLGLLAKLVVEWLWPHWLGLGSELGALPVATAAHRAGAAWGAVGAWVALGAHAFRQRTPPGPRR